MQFFLVRSKAKEVASYVEKIAKQILLSQQFIFVGQTLFKKK